ncbi:cytochrome c oxidase subunit 3 family protein [Desulfovibrio subterraneus]|jgi:cytochrome c oxidase subunit 3|uniref:Cytochrome oxidase subunit III n=1 Tax=Desulfovibrio subterraneus TaxID=2718620 RepID=A0A7J0BKT3_9BACT|nr:cytochrome c oxidase subunit 3 family protein [Desulfovibrio subterraneus]WBF67953.1 cytochrome c oxidase subunit 3 family protein [Desulfovibrio subterraneus]GFM33822.1 cytochrome oxidase subunit III [Desulfovibrio subterraneus]
MSAIKDYTGAKLGMWLFLFTEVLLFGGLFLLYAAYLHKFPAEFHLAGKELNVVLGGTNTVVLISSSWFMALAISALQQGRVDHCKKLMLLTLAMAMTFLVIKYFEWSAKIHHGIFPDSPELLARPAGEVVYFGLYYLMTGLHGLHVILGGGLITFAYVLIVRGKVTPQDFVFLENAGLYWHLVDLVWIYLFPLFYLIA